MFRSMQGFRRWEFIENDCSGLGGCGVGSGLCRKATTNESQGGPAVAGSPWLCLVVALRLLTWPITHARVSAAEPSAAIQLKLHFQSAVEASAEGREAEDFGVFFVEQIFDPAG